MFGKLFRPTKSIIDCADEQVIREPEPDVPDAPLRSGCSFTITGVLAEMAARVAGLVSGLFNTRHTEVCLPQTYCATDEESAGGDITSIRLGMGTAIWRWVRASTVTFTVCAESFPTRDKATYATGKLVEAVALWKGTGVTFRLVDRDCPATFRLVYRQMPASRDNRTLAQSFFPNADTPESRTLFVYGAAFREDNKKYMANFFAHEIGHILGLRHEFTELRKSVRFGFRDDASIMNYFSCPGSWRVQVQDIHLTALFYNYNSRTYRGLPIYVVTPPEFVTYLVTLSSYPYEAFKLSATIFS
ncbi:hypothetical protein DTO169E5_977 [Paecilomyces variotii]|nr:hypothetical protein DTO169E5_977 [Paecilomyces variotii]